MLTGIEADNKVTCKALEITTDVANSSFTASTSCGGKDAFGDDYAVLVDVAGTVSENFATVSSINLQTIP